MIPTKGRRPHHRPPSPGRLSGRFVLRLDPGLHAALKAAARERGVSLNDYCARRLAAPPGLDAPDDATRAVAHATRLFGGALLGIVVFGSWARGDAAADSDVDLLVVLDEGRPLTRDLYRHWDETPASWGGRPVEPHFVHLPQAGRVSGVWAEAALDGIVVFDRGYTVSRRLAGIRHDIVARRLVRRLVHGQPYWTEVA